MKITCKWDEDKNPETNIKYNDDYFGFNRLNKLDFLRDIIKELTDQYNKTLEAHNVRDK